MFNAYNIDKHYVILSINAIVDLKEVLKKLNN